MEKMQIKIMLKNLVKTHGWKWMQKNAIGIWSNGISIHIRDQGTVNSKLVEETFWSLGFPRLCNTMIYDDAMIYVYRHDNKPGNPQKCVGIPMQGRNG